MCGKNQTIGMYNQMNSRLQKREDLGTIDKRAKDCGTVLGDALSSEFVVMVVNCYYGQATKTNYS